MSNHHRINATPQSAVQRDDLSAMETTLKPSEPRAEIAEFRASEERYAQIERRRRETRIRAEATR
jgi:hypothetical protein